MNQKTTIIVLIGLIFCLIGFGTYKYIHLRQARIQLEKEREQLRQTSADAIYREVELLEKSLLSENYLIRLVQLQLSHSTPERRKKEQATLVTRINKIFASLEKAYSRITKHHSGTTSAILARDQLAALEGKKKRLMGDTIPLIIKTLDKQYQNRENQALRKSIVLYGQIQDSMRKKEYKKVGIMGKNLHQLLMLLYKVYPQSNMVGRSFFRLPMIVDSNPPGATVYRGRKKLGTTPLVYTYKVKDRGLQFVLEKKGFQVLTLPTGDGRVLDWSKFHHLKPALKLGK